MKSSPDIRLLGLTFASYGQFLLWLGMLFIGATLTLNQPAWLSIGAIVAFLGGCWHLYQTKPSVDPFLLRMGLALMGLFGVSLWGGFVTAEPGDWLEDLRMKLPFLLLPLPVLLSLPLRARALHVLLLFAIGVAAMVGILSVWKEFSAFDSYMERVNKNSSMRVITQMNHIYFGPMLGLSGLLGLQMALRLRAPSEKVLRVVYGTLGILCVITLHLFTSRTGFLAFYGGLGAWILWMGVQKRAWKLGLGMLVLAILLPVLSYQTVPAFRKRLEVTLWDFQQYERIRSAGEDLSNYTVGLRLAAWEASAQIWKQHPVFGTGLGDMGHDLWESYSELGIQAKPDQLLRSSHNQYMEYLAGGGTLGFAVFLCVLIYPIFNRASRGEVMVWTLTGLVLAACLSESFLERQAGISFYLFFILTFPSIFATLEKK